MLATTPPLWKDVDAYLQVTEAPNLVTIVHYGPLYCFSARLPLFFGYGFDCLRSGAALPSLKFFAAPILSDSGVQMLLWSQHLGLCCGALFVIVTATHNFVLRLLFAIFWALNPLFYSFAHCVGSETLSLILLLLLAGIGIRIMKCRSPVWAWVVFGLLITCSMLTRHINGVTAALLPLAFGFTALVRYVAARRAQSTRHRRWLFYRMRKDLLRGCAAIVLGIGSILLTQFTFRVASRSAGFDCHTRVGFSFAFRLNYFGPLTAAEREPLLARAAAHSRVPEVQALLQALRSGPVSVEKFDAIGLLYRTGQLLPPEIAQSMDKTDVVLNDAARAFLIAPSHAYFRAVAMDCREAMHTTIVGVVGQLIGSTEFGLNAPDKMPQAAKLVTFREPGSRVLLNRLVKHGHLALWRKFKLAHLLGLTMIMLLFAAFVRRSGSAELAGYSAALIVVGLLSIIGNNLVNEFQRRYTLPTWELTIVAMTLLAAALATSFHRDAERRKTVRLWKSPPRGS